MPKDFGSSFGRIKGQKCHLLGEFSRISGLKKSFAVCTTVVVRHSTVKCSCSMTNLFPLNCRRLKWDTVSQPINDLFEPEIQPNLPDNYPFSDSKNPKKYLAIYS